MKEATASNPLNNDASFATALAFVADRMIPNESFSHQFAVDALEFLFFFVHCGISTCGFISMASGLHLSAAVSAKTIALTACGDSHWHSGVQSVSLPVIECQIEKYTPGLFKSAGMTLSPCLWSKPV